MPWGGWLAIDPAAEVWETLSQNPPAAPARHCLPGALIPRGLLPASAPGHSPPFPQGSLGEDTPQQGVWDAQPDSREEREAKAGRNCK